VGAFIARISRGRTIRQFIVGVLIGPSLFSMIWFCVFGTAGIKLDQQTNGKFSETLYNDGAAVALFQFLDAYPLALLTSILALFLIFIFFVAGADAGCVVLGSMSAGGVLNPKVGIKLTWGVIMAVIAAVLLVVGGGGTDALDGLTNGAILAATPFGILMVPMCYGLLKTLRSDRRDEERREIEEIMTPQQAPTGSPPRPATGGGPAAQQMTAEDPLERGRHRTSE
jgi:choline-glycine betaine transporter